MSRPKSRMITALTLLACIAIGIAIVTVRRADAPVPGNVDELFGSLVSDEGERYLEVRTELLKSGANLKPYLAAKMRSQEWPEALVAEILLEHIAVPRAEGRLRKWKKPAGPFAVDFLDDVGDRLADRGKKNPIILVEALWKKTRIITWLRTSNAETHALVVALSRLRERRALFPLLEVAQENRNEDSTGLLTRVMAAIGNIPDRRALPPLLESFESVSEELVDSWKYAIFQCVDEESIALVEEHAQRIRDEKRKQGMLDAIQYWRDQQKRKGSTNPDKQRR